MGLFTYILNLRGGRKYVGSSSNPAARISDHFKGRGAAFTKRFRPIGVQSVYRHKTTAAGKRAERSAYFTTKSRYGASRVRGAGRTRSR